MHFAGCLQFLCQWNPTSEKRLDWKATDAPACWVARPPLRQRFSNCSVHRKLRKGLRRHRPLGPTLSFWLRWGQRTCISNKFPGDAAAGTLDTPLWGLLLLCFLTLHGSFLKEYYFFSKMTNDKDRKAHEGRSKDDWKKVKKWRMYSTFPIAFRHILFIIFWEIESLLISDSLGCLVLLLPQHSSWLP